jgi:hypothetical protein
MLRLFGAFLFLLANKKNTIFAKSFGASSSFFLGGNRTNANPL